MVNKEEYDIEAKEVIDKICSIIIEKYNFSIDFDHFYMEDGVSKVLVKNNLLIYFFWDYLEANIIWKFKERVDDYSCSIDYREIFTENSFYHGLKTFRKYCFKEKPSIYFDRFVPKAIEKTFLDYLEKWTNEYHMLFINGNYDLIKHLEKHGHQSAESMKIESDLINKMINN